MATPAEVLAARVMGAVEALSGLLAEAPIEQVEEAAGLLDAAVATLEPAGRVLGAANAALPGYEHPYARLFQAATTLREHRGDGHVAALVAHDLGPVEVLALRCGMDISRDWMQAARGWTDAEWTAGQARVVDRGLLDAEGKATDAGRELYAAVEEATNVAAEAPWTALGPDTVARLKQVLRPISVACRAAIPADNPIGLPTIA